MFEAQIMTGELHDGHLGSTEVTRSFSSSDNSQMKRARDLGSFDIATLCLSHYDTSTDV